MNVIVKPHQPLHVKRETAFADIGVIFCSPNTRLFVFIPPSSESVLLPFTKCYMDISFGAHVAQECATLRFACEKDKNFCNSNSLQGLNITLYGAIQWYFSKLFLCQIKLPSAHCAITDFYEIQLHRFCCRLLANVKFNHEHTVYI